MLLRMTDLSRIRRALISVSDKRGLVEFAKSLTQHGIELISTGGTAGTLTEAGLVITPVEQVTGFRQCAAATQRVGSATDKRAQIRERYR